MIYLVDSWLRRNRYDHGALLDERGGRYYRGTGCWPGGGCGPSPVLRGPVPVRYDGLRSS